MVQCGARWYGSGKAVLTGIEDETQKAGRRNAGSRSRCADGAARVGDRAGGVMVGAKEVTPRHDDMFDGSMDFVSIDIASSEIAQ